MRELFKFRVWKDKGELEYCGANLRQACGETRLGFADYAKKFKPITIPPNAPEDRHLDATQLQQFRVLIGVLQ